MSDLKKVVLSSSLSEPVAARYALSLAGWLGRGKIKRDKTNTRKLLEVL